MPDQARSQHLARPRDHVAAFGVASRGAHETPLGAVLGGKGKREVRRLLADVGFFLRPLGEATDRGLFDGNHGARARGDGGARHDGAGCSRLERRGLFARRNERAEREGDRGSVGG